MKNNATVELQNFFYDKRVLVTGHVTYLYSWLCILLHKMGARLIGFSIQEPDIPNLYKEADVHEFMHVYVERTGNMDVLERINKEFQPEIVIQLSSICGYVENHDVRGLYMFNLPRVLNTLEMSRQSSHVRVFVNLIPDYLDNTILRKCNITKTGEIKLMMGSFRLIEFLTAGYRNAYFNPENHDSHKKSFVNLSFLNPIGGGDWSRDNTLKNYFDSLEKNEKKLIVCPGSRHSLIHVIDVMMKVLDIVYKLYTPSKNEIVDYKMISQDSFLKDEVWMAEFLKDLYHDKNFTIKTDQKFLFDETLTTDMFHMPDYKQITDWVPRWDVRTALVKTIEWYQARERGANMQRYSFNQIDEFLDRQQPISLPLL
jgi:CDP-glucose 4,6-dehydratase